jgi:hypothetical protein
MASMIGGIISLTVSVVVLAQVYITTVKGTNTTAFTASEVSMWNLLTLIAIVGMVYGVANIFGIV